MQYFWATTFCLSLLIYGTVHKDNFIPKLLIIFMRDISTNLWNTWIVVCNLPHIWSNMGCKKLANDFVMKRCVFICRAWLWVFVHILIFTSCQCTECFNHTNGHHVILRFFNYMYYFRIKHLLNLLVNSDFPISHVVMLIQLTLKKRYRMYTLFTILHLIADQQVNLHSR